MRRRSEMENLRGNTTYREEERKRAQESYAKKFEALTLKEDKRKSEHERDRDTMIKIHKICIARQYCDERGKADGKGFEYHMTLFIYRLFKSDPKEGRKFCEENFLFRECPKCKAYYDADRCGKHPDGCLSSRCTLQCENCVEVQAHFLGGYKNWADMTELWEEIRKTDPDFVGLAYPSPEEMAEECLIYREKQKEANHCSTISSRRDRKSGVEVVQRMYARHKENPERSAEFHRSFNRQYNSCSEYKVGHLKSPHGLF